MKRFGGFGAWIWILLGILGLTTALLYAGRNQTRAFPATDSYLPSGTRAFRELLEASGYRVIVDREVKPIIAKDEVPLRFIYRPTDTDADLSSIFAEDSETEEESQNEPEKPSPLQSAIDRHVVNGGVYVELPYFDDFMGDSQENLQPISLRRPGAEREFKGTFATYPDLPAMEGKDLVEIFGNTEVATYIWRRGAGEQLIIANGLSATNRFLGQHDNAQILLESIGVVAPPGSTIRILEGGFNPIARGFLATIGNWALAGWYQLLLLAIVIGWTLGKRLGLPIKERSGQRGTREMLDGIADTLARKRRSTIALEYAIERNARKLRNHLRLPASVALPDLLRPLPDLLRNAFVQCEVLSHTEKVSEATALKAVQRLEKEVAAFLGEAHRSRLRGR